MASPRIGTCSWNFPSWEGVLYEDGRLSGPELLLAYATRFDAVEVDRWFWSLFAGGRVRLPDPEDAKAYRGAVPDSFRFAVKVPNSITLTHEYSKTKGDPLVRNPHFLSESLLAEFLDRLRPMHDVLGPTLFQFEYLNRQKMPSRNAFLDALEPFARSLPKDFSYGIEVRNPRYLDEAFYGFLAEMGLCPVLISGYWMPSLGDLFDEHRERLCQFDTVVIRLMGSDRSGIEAATGKAWNRIVDPHNEELQSVAGILKDLTRAGRTPFLFVNNHYEGSAPLTITRLIDHLAHETPGG